MNKLEELEKSLKDYKALLEKTMDAMGAEPVATDMNQAPMGKKEKDHKDEKEDKQIIAEALDQHNEKKHGEDKDEDSAKKDMKVEKGCNDMVKFETNGQWSIKKQ